GCTSSGHRGTRFLRRGRGGQLLPLARRSKAMKVEQGSAVDGGMADRHDPSKSGQGLLVDFLASEQVRIVEEIAEEPAEFPQCFCSAIDAPRNHPLGEFVRFKDREAEDV